MPVNDSARQERAGRNQSLFRVVNEDLKDELTADTPATTRGDQLSISCECADMDCTEKLTLGVREYEAIRTNPTHFVILRGHEVREVERVVGLVAGRLIVEKIGAAAAIAKNAADG